MKELNFRLYRIRIAYFHYTNSLFGDGNLTLSAVVFPPRIPRLLRHHLGSQGWNQTTAQTLQRRCSDISTECLGSGECGGSRTPNLLVKSEMLTIQLSYAPFLSLITIKHVQTFFLPHLNRIFFILHYEQNIKFIFNKRIV